MASPRLGYVELVAAQATPETTTNEIARYLEAFANATHFKSRANNPAEPGSPADGDCYLLTGTPTGTHWSGKGGKIAFYENTAWVFITAKEGFIAWVDDEDVIIAYTGSVWNSISTGNPTESIIIAASDETTALTTGDKVTFRMPYAFTLTSVKCSLTTAQTSGSIFTVEIKKAGSTIFSTKPTLDNTEKTTATAATASVLSTTALADDDEMVVNINQIGDGTAKGLKVVLIGHR